MSERLALDKPIILSPNDQLGRINHFIETTQTYTLQQLAWLRFMERWAGNNEAKVTQMRILEAKIDDDIKENVGCLVAASINLSRNGQQLKVVLPDMLAPVTVEGFGFSTDSKTYEVCVQTPGPAIVPLTTKLQLS